MHPRAKEAAFRRLDIDELQAKELIENLDKAGLSTDLLGQEAYPIMWRAVSERSAAGWLHTDDPELLRFHFERVSPRDLCRALETLSSTISFEHIDEWRQTFTALGVSLPYNDVDLAILLSEDEFAGKLPNEGDAQEFAQHHSLSQYDGPSRV